MKKEVEKTSNIIVIKIGGSCITNGKTVKTIIEKINRVKKNGFMPVIVVSAMKGMTDSLLDFAANGHSQKNPKIIDSIISEGEQLSAKIIRSALQSIGANAKEISLSDPNFPIITDDHHGVAIVILEETEKRIRDTLTPTIINDIIPIIPGFVGKTKHGEITTMGRGGSDTTAILIGKALNAKEVILLKDVPGILSGDPKIVNSPEKISKIFVEEALDLGVKGGKILCPISLVYKPKNVKVRIVNFDTDDIFTGGTEVFGELEDKMKVEIQKENKVAVTIIGNKMSGSPGLLAKFSTALYDRNINIYSVSASNFSICFYVDMKHEETTLKIFHDFVLEDNRLTAVTSMSDISLITIIGKDFATIPGILGSIGNALAGAGINIIDITTSVCEADILVDRVNAEKAKHILEEIF